jgi:DNA-directed RNA polymerase specialized sigma24 family protein
MDRQQLIADLLLAHRDTATLAVLLTGRTEVAGELVKQVMQRAVGQWRSWPDDEAAPKDWFLHHTLLAGRRAVFVDDALPDPDALLEGLPPNPEYAAFLRALRKLPFQQLEALLLFDVLRLNARTTSVAMDMSTAATTHHLETARATLRTLAADRYEPLLENLRTFAQAHAPNDAQLLPQIHLTLRAQRQAQRLSHAKRAALTLAAAALAWYALHRLGLSPF